MNVPATQNTSTKDVSPQEQFRSEMQRMADQFVAALPEHIKPERFQRIVLTAVLGDPALLKADRKSLLESAMRAAQDGLMPDKREGAFVVFNTKVNGNWIKAVQWMPMIGGIIKKMHQSGDVSVITAKVVYGGDEYRTWVDNNGEHIVYQPAENPDYDTIRQVFAMAKMKDGSVYVEALTTRDIEKIRQVSRSKDKGPWVDWWEEMAKKSAIRRLAKRLNLTPEIHDLIQRDNAMYDLSQAPAPRPSMASKLSGPATDEGFSTDYIDQEVGGNNAGAEDAEHADTTQPEPNTETARDLTASAGDSEAGSPSSLPASPSDGTIEIAGRMVKYLRFLLNDIPNGFDDPDEAVKNLPRTIPADTSDDDLRKLKAIKGFAMNVISAAEKDSDGNYTFKDGCSPEWLQQEAAQMLGIDEAVLEPTEEKR